MTRSPRSLTTRLSGLAALVWLAGCPTTPEPVEPPVSPARWTGDQGYLDEALALIDGAREELLVSQFQIIEDGVVEQLTAALVAAAERGVRVEVLVDEEVSGSPLAVESLRARGVDARLDGSEVRLHAKLLAADGAVALVGSTNWSDGSILRNRERDLVVEGEAAAEVAAYLSALLADPARDVVIDSDEIWADRAILPGLLAHLAAAEQHIDLLLYGIRIVPEDATWPTTQLCQALIDAQQRGVEVRVVFEAGRNETLASLNQQAAAFLEFYGVTVRWEDPNRITHAKQLLVDDSAVIGSANWGAGAMTSYHELLMASAAPGLAAELRADFDLIWADALDEHP